MDVFAHLVGQPDAVATLRAAASGPGMTHAWLFTGPAGSGCSRAALMDALLLSRVRAAIEQHFAAGATTLGSIDATVSSGKVTLEGATSDERMIVEAVRLVHTVQGVKGVESKISHISFRPSM